MTAMGIVGLKIALPYGRGRQGQENGGRRRAPSLYMVAVRTRPYPAIVRSFVLA